jgi:hypothetical protein
MKKAATATMIRIRITIPKTLNEVFEESSLPNIELITSNTSEIKSSMCNLFRDSLRTLKLSDAFSIASDKYSHIYGYHS